MICPLFVLFGAWLSFAQVPHDMVRADVAPHVLDGQHSLGRAFVAARAGWAVRSGGVRLSPGAIIPSGRLCATTCRVLVVLKVV